MTDTAVVILNFNGRKYLEKFLPSVIEHSAEASIIIVDNASTDDSLIYLQSNHPELEVISFAKNLGFTGGYNEALNQINADIFVLLNTDVEVTQDWLTPIVNQMKANPDIAACQPKILSYKQKDQFEYAGAAGGFIDYLGYPFCRGRIFQSLEKDEGQYDDSIPVFWASGACLFLRKDTFFKMGCFDEDYFAHMEEIDLCWRIQNAGYSIFYNGHSTVYHVGGGTLSHSNPRKTYLNFRNGLSMFMKNEKPGRLWWKLPLRGFLDIIAALKFILADSWKDAFAVINAHFDFWKRFSTNMRKRSEAKKLWSNRNPNLRIYKGFIVLDHFLLRKMRYTQISAKNKSK
jgi:GT2 family glycosyltransferase